MGISRDDSSAFIPKYMEKGIMEDDPFHSIDLEGVGFLVEKSVKDGLEGNPDLSLSVCGEHGGDPKSIKFFDEVGLNYVSCSPFRVPIARLACGQAAARRMDAEVKIEERIAHSDHGHEMFLLSRLFHMCHLDRIAFALPFGHHRTPASKKKRPTPSEAPSGTTKTTATAPSAKVSAAATSGMNTKVESQ